MEFENITKDKKESVWFDDFSYIQTYIVSTQF